MKYLLSLLTILISSSVLAKNPIRKISNDYYEEDVYEEDLKRFENEEPNDDFSSREELLKEEDMRESGSSDFIKQDNSSLQSPREEDEYADDFNDDY